VGNRSWIGRRFDKLIVVAYDGMYRLCQCDCGNTKRIHASNVQSARSCGCLRTTHGETRSKADGQRRGSPEFNAWQAMHRRCNDPSCKRYHGREIVVCPRWHSFKSFLHDMGRKPGATFTLERSDNDRGYAPGNVRWATRREQARNTSRNRRFTFDGRTLCLTDWAVELGIDYEALRGRLRRGWQFDQAINVPFKVYSK